ncbi:MAG: response regulator [Symploca sp. SIO3C6]|nr:response regulator [Symploca sp. SIO3C6]
MGKFTKEDSKKAVILIVDDKPSNLQVLFTYLEQVGFKVLVAQNGESAIKIAEFALPDLILLDILMPGINGFDTCRKLKAQASTQDIPVIFLTALSETVNQVKGFELGGVDYITKPIEQEEVLARIKTHLTLRKMRQRLAEQNQKLQLEIIQRKQVELQLQERTSQLEKVLNFKALLRRITEKIRDSLDESQILQTATEELAVALQVECCKIELYNSSQTTATIAYETSTALSKYQGTTRKIIDSPQIYQQLLQKQTIKFVNVASEFNHNKRRFSYLACPIFESQGIKGIIGNLWLLRAPAEIFEEFEVKLVQQVAAQCAIAIRQARLFSASVEQLQELEKLNRLKDDFLKTISHELRSPMSSIQLAAKTLETLFQAEATAQKSPTFTRVLKIFNQACQRQNQLVDDLLSLCYLDAKAQTLVCEEIDLSTWIPEIVQIFLARTENQSQQLEISLPEQLPLLISDISTLERILMELLNNACKYTPAGGTITVFAQATEQIIRLSISNSGVEIPPEEIERIFEQFYRIPNNDPWQYGGTGLGLTLVKKLTELIEASVEVESKEGKTTFSVNFARNEV